MSTDALPSVDPSLLPDDPAVLKALVMQLLGELRDARARLERQEHHMDLLLKRLYGSSSEKSDPRQGMLFDAPAGEEAVTASPSAPPQATSPVSPHRDRHGRGRIPDEIQREELVHDLSAAEMAATRARQSRDHRSSRGDNSPSPHLPRSCATAVLSLAWWWCW